MIDQRWSFHSAILGGAIVRSHASVAEFLARHPIGQLAGLVNAQSAVLAYADATYVTALIAALFMPLVFLMKKPGRPQGQLQVGG